MVVHDRVTESEFRLSYSQKVQRLGMFMQRNTVFIQIDAHALIDTHNQQALGTQKWMKLMIVY